MAKPDLTRWTFLAFAFVGLLTLGAPSGATPITSVTGITPVTAGPAPGCWTASMGAPLASPDVTLNAIAALSSADVRVVVVGQQLRELRLLLRVFWIRREVRPFVRIGPLVVKFLRTVCIADVEVAVGVGQGGGAAAGAASAARPFDRAGLPLGAERIPSIIAVAEVGSSWFQSLWLSFQYELSSSAHMDCM